MTAVNSYSVLDLDVPALEARITPALESVEELLNDAVRGGRDLVEELTRHLSVAGGKRIRPALTLVCAQLGDPERATSERVISAATAMELTHLASLYHDDVMDSAPTRRGVTSAQHMWGNNRAILAGDVLFARASRLIASLGPESVAHHSDTFERLCMGQLNETFGPPEDADPVEFYLQVLADKTGSLLSASAFFGAFHGGAGREVADLVATFGEKVGVAFQIADDVLDLASTGETSGKTPGTDLREGVDTLPVLLLRRHVAHNGDDTAGQEILDAIDGDLSSDDVLADVVDKLRHHQVLQETRDLAEKWCDDAVTVLDALDDSEPKEALTAFAHLMVNRLS